MQFTVDLSGKSALVTGASSGLGRHFAEVLAGAGAKVAVAARRADMVASVCEAIRSRGGTAAPIQLDVTERALIQKAVSESAAALGGLDILVNNAGVTATKAFSTSKRGNGTASSTPISRAPFRSRRRLGEG
jgi:NAD(P)-dependent dehydrogenase (short-subunit alcohol dehydrogenase family)